MIKLDIMPVTMEALSVLLLMLPGFWALNIINALNPDKREKQLFNNVISVMGLSLFIYVPYWIFLELSGSRLPQLPVGRTGLAFEPTIHIVPLGITLVVATLIGFTWGKLKASDKFFQFFQRISQSPFSSSTSIWNQLFNAHQKKSIASVRLKNGKIYTGWLGKSSTDPDNPEIELIAMDNSKQSIFLTDTVRGKKIRISKPSVLIPKSSEIEAIEFEHARMIE